MLKCKTHTSFGYNLLSIFVRLPVLEIPNLFLDIRLLINVTGDALSREINLP